jgi:hypothetical protein
MPSFDKETGTKTYTTEDRQFVVKDQHLQRMYNVVDAINNVLQTAGGSGDEKFADPRIDMLTMLLTTFVLDEKKCVQLLDKRDEKIDAISKECKSDVKRANKQIFRENIKMIARCFEEFDPFLGLKKKQVVMEVTNDDLRKKAMDFGVFECTEAFAIDKTKTLNASLWDAIDEIKATEERVKTKGEELRKMRKQRDDNA